MTKILIVGDTHAKPGVSNERFTWLGKFIVESKPEKVVQIGDFADMPSLCSYDKGKRSFEGRRYKHDIESAIDAQQKMFNPIKSAKKKLPEFYMTLGNHDQHRIERATQLDSTLDGTIGIEDLQYEKFGWKVTRFKEILFLDNIALTHYFTAGLLDTPIGGVNVAQTILNKMHTNAFQGHQHVLSLANTTLANGKRIWGGSVGCFFEHKEDYVSARAQADWWRGVVELEVINGEIQDISLITLATLKKEYKR